MNLEIGAEIQSFNTAFATDFLHFSGKVMSFSVFHLQNGNRPAQQLVSVYEDHMQ